jgi:hypothetical protein
MSVETLGGGIHVGLVLKASEADTASGIHVDNAPVNVASVHVTGGCAHSEVKPLRPRQVCRADACGSDSIDPEEACQPMGSSADPIVNNFVLPKKRFCLEIFGGSCRLTREFERCGVDALGIDWQHNLDEAEGKCISMNLGTESGHNLVW